MRFGVVLFDDVFRKSTGARKRSSTEGWAAIDGLPARRIVSINELEGDVKWWTNYDFVDFNANFLGRHPNFFFSGFLRTELKTISQEIGAGVEQMSADRSAQCLAALFGRIMRLAITSLKVNANGGGLGVKTLCDLIQGRSVNKNKIPDEFNQSLQHAYQPWVSVMQRVPKDWRVASLRHPRYTHALDILGTPVPGEHRWTYVNNAQLPQVQAERIDWCIAHDLPVLVNVVVKPRRGDYSAILSYNGGASTTRSWVCQPELLFLSQFCDIEVIGAFICDGGFEMQKEIETVPSLGDFSLASYSLGLVVENLWVAMASPRTGTMGKKFYPPRAIWYRTMDRITMFMSAVRLQKAGFQITGYGTGAVLLCYPAGATEDLVGAANELGLDVPLSKYADLRTEVRLNADE